MEAGVELVRSGDRTRTSCTHERTCVGAAKRLNQPSCSPKDLHRSFYRRQWPKITMLIKYFQYKYISWLYMKIFVFKTGILNEDDTNEKNNNNFNRLLTGSWNLTPIICFQHFRLPAIATRSLLPKEKRTVVCTHYENNHTKSILKQWRFSWVGLPIPTSVSRISVRFKQFVTVSHSQSFVNV